MARLKPEGLDTSNGQKRFFQFGSDNSVASAFAVRTETDDYDITNNDDVILCDVSGGAITVTLPTAVGITGKVFNVKKIAGGFFTAITVETTGSETIDGAANDTITFGNTNVTYVSDGSNYYII